MTDDIMNIFQKYSKTTLDNLNTENMYKIIIFLEKEKCNCIEDMLEDYLDVFTIDYEIFIEKYYRLNKKYNKQYLNKVSEDMNYLEELFED